VPPCVWPYPREGHSVFKRCGSSEDLRMCVDVFTVGPYARKSWILPDYAFGDGYSGRDHRGNLRTLTIRGFGWPQEDGILVVMFALAGYITRSSGFISRESVRKLGQPNPSARCSWPAVETHRPWKLRQPFQYHFKPPHHIAAPVCERRDCLDDEPGLNERT